jgi:hypothetical protein
MDPDEVESRDDLVRFIGWLVEEWIREGETWENQTPATT